jgi:hypothetical protein
MYDGIHVLVVAASGGSGLQDRQIYDRIGVGDGCRSQVLKAADNEIVVMCSEKVTSHRPHETMDTQFPTRDTTEVTT